MSDEFSDDEKEKFNELRRKYVIQNYKQKLEKEDIPPDSLTVEVDDEEFDFLGPYAKYNWLREAEHGGQIDESVVLESKSGTAHIARKFLFDGDVVNEVLCERGRLNHENLTLVDKALSEWPIDDVCGHCMKRLRKLRAAQVAIGKAKGEVPDEP